MTNFESELCFDLVLPAVKVPHQKQVFQCIAEETAKVIGIREQLLMSRFAKTEPSFVTGGVCLIEMKISSLTQPFMIFARAPKITDLTGADGKAADLFAVYLSPEHGGAAHLQTLARWSRLLHDVAFCDRLRGADDADDIRLLTKAETRVRTTVRAA